MRGKIFTRKTGKAYVSSKRFRRGEHVHEILYPSVWGKEGDFRRSFGSEGTISRQTSES